MIEALLVALRNGDLAGTLQNKLTIYLVVGGLLTWAGWSGLRLWRATSRLQSALQRATARVSQSENAVAFAGDYEAVRNALRNEPLLKPRWEEYAPSLILPRGGAPTPIRSTTRPSLWFDLSMLRGADLRYHAALPNLLVGMGLLFTFLGLAVALSTAGGVVSGTADARSAEMEKLLNAASFKFVTSLAGLAFSIAYALFRKSRLRAVETALSEFHVALEQRIELLTSVELQQATNDLLRDQATHLQTFSTELAINIGQAFDEKLDGRLGQYIEPLTRAMERLADRETADREGAIERMLERFLTGLQAGTGDRMQDVAGTLERLGSRLDGVQTGLVDATNRMADAAGDMGRRMGEGADAALGRVNDGMTSLVGTLREMVEATRGAGQEAGQAVADRLEAAAGQVAAALERAGHDSGGALGRGVEDAVGRIVAATEGMRTELAAVAVALRTEAAAGGEALRAAGQDSSRLMGETLDRFTREMSGVGAAMRETAESTRGAGADAAQRLAERLEGTAAQVATALERAGQDSGGALGRGVEEAVGRIVTATEGMRTELAAVAAELRTEAMAGGEALRAGGAAGAASLQKALGESGEAVTSALRDGAERVRAAGETAGSALERGGSAAGSRLDEAGGAFGSRAEELASRVAALAAASDGIVVRMADLDRAARDAAAPLVAAATDLRAAGEGTRALINRLDSTARNLDQALGESSRAIARLEATGSAAGRLAETVTNAAARFEGLDRELDSVFRELQTGLSGFARQVAEVTKQTDSNLGQAATQLGNVVTSLTEALEDLGDRMPPANGGGTGGRPAGIR